MTSPGGQGGLFASLRRLADTLVETAQVRIALLGTELEREKLRLVDAALLAAVGLLLIGVSLVLLVALVVLMFEEAYRLPALAVVLVVFVAGGLLLLFRARALFAADEGQPFALTLRELRRDREAFGARMAGVRPGRRGEGAEADDPEAVSPSPARRPPPAPSPGSESGPAPRD